VSEPPAGDVDPTDPASVARVLDATVGSAGLEAIGDLLARLPGARTTPAVPRGFLRAAVPGAVWLGTEWCWSMTEPPTLLQVVGEVVLHRIPMEPGLVGGALSRPVAELVRRTGAVADASIVLTVARDLAAEA
jgi:hypothetical protein